MPTGYTAAIANGIDFETFVMQCARAMGALVAMRDEPANAPIPERFEPSDYHTQRLAEANAELARLCAMSHEEAEVAAKEDFATKTRSNSEAIARIRALRSKYESMLAKVLAWTPPTPDHVEFKQFMVNQLNESIKFDCSERFYEEHQLRQQTGTEWLENQITEITRFIRYHSVEKMKEIERTESRNRWLAALRGSLK